MHLILALLFLAAPSFAGADAAAPEPASEAASAGADAAAPAPKGPPAPLAVPEPPAPDARFVRVWANATWRDGLVGPQAFVGLDYDDAERPRRFGQGYVAVLIEDHGGLLEVEVGHDLWTTGSHCSSEGAVPYGHVLRFFVDRRDLMPVLAQPWEQRFDDGTGLRLHPGVPVLGAQVLAGRLVLPLVAPEGLVSDTYIAAPRGERDNPLGHVPQDAALTVAGRPVALHPDLSGTRHAPWFATDEPDGGRHLLTSRSACGEVTVSSPVAPALPSGGGGLLGSMMGPEARLTAEPGTAVYWADGRRAGALRTAQSWGSTELSEGPLRCRGARFGGETARGVGSPLRLCYDARDLTEHAPQEDAFEGLLGK